MLYYFQVDNIVIQYLYGLWRDHRDTSSYHLSLCKTIAYNNISYAAHYILVSYLY